MYKYIRINGQRKCFWLESDNQTAVFGPCGNILGSAIHRMNKSRYKIYIIWTCGATEMIFNGIGEAMDWLQERYNNEVQ